MVSRCVYNGKKCANVFRRAQEIRFCTSWSINSITFFKCLLWFFFRLCHNERNGSGQGMQLCWSKQAVYSKQISRKSDEWIIRCRTAHLWHPQREQPACGRLGRSDGISSTASRETARTRGWSSPWQSRVSRTAWETTRTARSSDRATPRSVTRPSWISISWAACTSASLCRAAQSRSKLDK